MIKKYFAFEVEIAGPGMKYKKYVQESANHLRGAIRKVFQNYPNTIGIARILRG